MGVFVRRRLSCSRQGYFRAERAGIRCLSHSFLGKLLEDEDAPTLESVRDDQIYAHPCTQRREDTDLREADYYMRNWIGQGDVCIRTSTFTCATGRFRLLQLFSLYLARTLAREPGTIHLAAPHALGPTEAVLASSACRATHTVSVYSAKYMRHREKLCVMTRRQQLYLSTSAQPGRGGMPTAPNREALAELQPFPRYHRFQYWPVDLSATQALREMLATAATRTHTEKAEFLCGRKKAPPREPAKSGATNACVAAPPKAAPCRAAGAPL